MLAYTPAQIRRYSVVRPDRAKTREVHSLYPPSASSTGPGAVVVAWDPLGPSVAAGDPLIPKPNAGRWCLAYDTEGHFATDDNALGKARVYRVFYYWQGQGDSYLEADTGVMAQWLKDHDMWSGNHSGEWHDRMFSAEARERARIARSSAENSVDHLREIYDRHKEAIQSQFGTVSHYNGRGPNNGSKYFGGSRGPSRLRRWVDRRASE